MSFIGNFVPLQQGIIVLGSGVGSSIGSGTSETTLGTVAVPANLLGATGKLRLSTFWTYTSSANTKTLRGRFSGASGTIFFNFGPTTSTSAYIQHTIHNVSASSQKGFNGGSTIFGITSNAVVTAAVDTTAATSVVFTGQPGAGGEVVTLEHYLVELIPGV